jgi:hypothetical protein
MAKAKKKPKLEDYVELSEDLYIAAGNLVNGTPIAKELAPIFFQQLYDFDKENLKSYRPEDWHFMFFLWLMGVSTGVQNSDSVKNFTKLIDSKKPIRLQ